MVSYASAHFQAEHTTLPYTLMHSRLPLKLGIANAAQPKDDGIVQA